MSVVYDAGVLVAADRNDREVWADHRARLELGLLPVTTAPVVAQVSRAPKQVQLRRFLRGCEIAPFAGSESQEIGSLLARSGTADVVDGHVVLTAGTHRSPVITADPDDLRHLSDHATTPVRVLRL